MKRILLFTAFCASVLLALAQDINSEQLVYYPFSGNGNNASGSGINNGTVAGATLIDGYDGAANSAYSFDGVNDQILFGDLDLTTESFTISFWIKLPEVSLASVSYRLLSQRATCALGFFFDIAYSHTAANGYNVGLEMYGGSSSVSGHVNTGAIANPQEWNHITFTKDNDTKTSKAHVNGKLVGTTSWTIPANTAFSIGNTAQLGISNSPCINNTSTKYFNGALDEIRIHKRVITQAELESLLPFFIDNTFPAKNQTQASVSSGIVLSFTKNLNPDFVNSTNISVSGSISGSLTPVISGADSKELTLDFANNLAYGEVITVTASGLKSQDGATIDTETFSFTTSTEAESLRAHYMFDGAITDASTFANNLIFSGNDPAYTQNIRSEFNTAIALNAQIFLYSGTEGFSSLKFGQNEDFSIGFWMKAGAGTTVRPILEQPGPPIINISLNASGQISFKITNGANSQEVVSTERYDNSTWHHVAITADRNNEYRMYVNSVLVASEPVNQSFNLLNSNPWYVNFSPTSPSLRYNGLLDDLKFYNQALTFEEVKVMADLMQIFLPADGDLAIRKDQHFTMEFSQKIAAASAVPGSFSLVGSVSGQKNVTVTGGDSRKITIIPESDFVLDEQVTLTYTNLQIENGDLLSGTLNYETADVNKGMLFYYPMNGNANNSVSNDYNGNVVGATLTEGFDGSANGAYTFNGSATIEVAELGLNKESYAMAFWMKRNDTKARVEIAGQRNSCNASQFMELSSSYNIYNGLYEVVFANTSTIGGFSSHLIRTPIEPNVWTHIIAERDAQDGKLRLYKNGVLVGETDFDGNYSIYNTKKFTLGNGNACVGVDGRQAFNGDLDEFRFYRRSINREEIAKLVDFMFEGSMPALGDTAVSATSGVYMDFNLPLDADHFTAANVSVRVDGNLFTEYNVTLKGDSILVKPNHSWPDGKEVTITASDLVAESGETLSHAISFTTATATESRLLHLAFDGSIVDTGIHAHTLTALGAVTYTNNRILESSKALSFSNTANALKIPAAELSDISFGTEKDFTVATWFNTTVAPSNRDQMIFSRIASTLKMQLKLKSAGYLQFEVSDYNTTQTLSIPFTPRMDDGKWHHVAVSVDRDGDMVIYVDGLAKATAPTKNMGMTVLGDLTIGGTYSALDIDFFRGKLDDFMIFNRAFSQEEIAEIAPFYTVIQPLNGTDYINLNQSFTIEFLRAVSTSSAISTNFTITGSKSGTHTAMISGGGSRNLTVNPDVDFAEDEAVTVAFSGLEDADGNPIADRSYQFETFNINKGMFVYYPFLGDAKNEAMDLYNGTVNGATLIADRNDNPASAYSFDGTDFIDVGAIPLNTQSFSVSFWFKRDAVQEVQLIAGQRASCNGSNQMNIGCSYSATTDSYAIGMSIGSTALGSFQTASVSMPVTPDVWTHISLVRDNEAGLLKLYLNGSLEVVQSFNTAFNVSNTASFGISSGSACINVDATRRFTGDLDEFRIYNRAITADEAAQLPNLLIDPPAIVKTIADLMLNEDEGPVIVCDLDTVFSSTSAIDYQLASSNAEVQAWIDGSLLMVDASDDFFGTSNITVEAFTGITAKQSFNVEFHSVNDAPEFALSESQLIITKNFVNTQVIQLADLSPANESSQSITYSIDPQSVNFANVDFNTATGQLMISSIPDELGTQIFTITADDGQASNHTYSTTFSLEVVDNLAPVIDQIASDITMNEDNAEVVAIDNLQAAFSDPNGDDLTFLAESDNAGVNVSIADNQVLVSLDPDFFGNANITVTASDGSMEISDSFEVTVNPVNDAPDFTLSNQNISLDEDFSSPVSLTVTSLQPANESGQALIYSLSPATVDFANVTFNTTTGDVTIEAIADKFGTQQFTITANDGEASNNTASATFSLTVNSIDDAPGMTFEQSYTYQEDFAGTEGIYPTVSHPANESQALTFSVSPAALDFAEMLFDTSNGRIHLIATENGFGTADVNVSVSDGVNTVAQTFSITVNPINDAPAFELSRTAIELGQDFAGSESITLTDLSPANETETVTYSINPASITFANMDFNNQTGQVSFSAVSGANGSQSFTITAQDGQSVNNTFAQSFTFTVLANRAPVVANPINNVAVAEDAGSIVITSALSSVFSDPDGDNLTYSASSNSEMVSAVISENALLANIAENYHGNVTITLAATDGIATTTTSFMITVTSVNDAPVIVQLPSMSLQEDQATATLDVATIFQDADGDDLTYILGNNSSPNFVAALEGSILSVTPQPDKFGTHTLSIGASDGTVTTAYQLVVNIANVNDAPRVINQPSFSFDEDGAAQTLALSGIFADADDDALSFFVDASESEEAPIMEATISGNSLVVTPLADAFGTTSLLLTAADAEVSVSVTISVTISGINDTPVFTLSTSGISMLKNFTQTQTISITPGFVPANESAQMVTYSVTPNDGSLVNISLEGNSISISAVSGAVGSQTYTITASDGSEVNGTFAQTFTVTVTEILGLDDTKVAVYPNPATAYIILESNQSGQFKIYDLNGAVIKTGQFNEKTDVQKLYQGMYLIRFQNASGKEQTEKLIIRH